MYIVIVERKKRKKVYETWKKYNLEQRVATIDMYTRGFPGPYRTDVVIVSINASPSSSFHPPLARFFPLLFHSRYLHPLPHPRSRSLRSNSFNVSN